MAIREWFRTQQLNLRCDVIFLNSCKEITNLHCLNVFWNGVKITVMQGIKLTTIDAVGTSHLVFML